MGHFTIKEIRINDEICPLGLDEIRPLLSWRMESGETGFMQKKAQILVGLVPSGCDFWDSGILETDCSLGTEYGGRALLPETRYYVTVRVWDQQENMQEASTWFETGMLNPDISAWEGARWIGAPEYLIAGDRLGTFIVESTIQITEGSRAGLVFGAGDPRLLDRSKNEYLIEGENYIRYVLDYRKDGAFLEIWRVGYCPEDTAGRPLWTVPVRDISSGDELITPENRNDPHRLRIVVTGNAAFAQLDGIRIDEELQEKPYGIFHEPRTLNPLGAVDVTTFPRLNRVGYYVGEGSRAKFDGITLRNATQEKAVLLHLDEEGRTISGECQTEYETSRHALPMLRRTFRVKKKMVSARLYATARGIYECSINGKRVGEEYFAPGASQFDHHLLYQTYDVTELLREGENGIGAVLAPGWWSDSLTFRIDNYNFWGDRMSFLARLVIRYEDGERESIVTDPSEWEYYGEGPVRYASFFQGEQFDAEKAWILRDFSLPGFSIDGLKKPAELRPVPREEKEPIFPGAAVWPARNVREPELMGSPQAPVREVLRIHPKSVREALPGVFLYDLGQEITGVPCIHFRENKGTQAVIRYGEMLYPQLPKYGKLAGLMLQVNLRDASSTDVYLCSGEEGEVFQPRFTFHGFRYIEISGVTKAPELSEVEGVQISSVNEITGSFSCSDALVNRFVQNVGFSQLGNFISIPTDCPQRNERMGWLGDTHIFCRTATFQSNVKNFYLRNLQAMRDMQQEDGRFPNIAPFGGGFGGMTYESAMILIVWELYQQYGTREVIDEYYDSMARWMEAIGKAGLPGIPVIPFFLDWLGDWLAPVPADDNLIFNAFHYRNAVLMEKFAEILGKETDRKRYREEAEKTRAYWNKIFVDPETGRTRNTDGSLCDAQGSYSIGLSCGVFEERFRERAFRYLAEKTIESNYTIQTGFFGTGSLNPMLSEGGYPQIAQKTMTQTAYPSWLYPVTQGATTIWERWNGFTEEDGFGDNNSMNSFNHYSLGSVLSWLYEYTLGIRRDESHPGCKHFFLKPEIGTFRYAGGGIDTPHGRIESSWEETKDGIVYKCSIPANTTADLTVGDLRKTLGSGRYCFKL